MRQPTNALFLTMGSPRMLNVVYALDFGVVNLTSTLVGGHHIGDVPKPAKVMLLNAFSHSSANIS